MAGSLCRVRIFISDLLRATIFIFIQLKQRPFILRNGLFESDGCRIIYLFSLRDPGHNIYFKVFDGQDIYFKKLPPPPQSTVRPLKKKGTSFNHSQIVPTDILNTYACPTGFDLVLEITKNHCCTTFIAILQSIVNQFLYNTVLI